MWMEYVAFSKNIIADMNIYSTYDHCWWSNSQPSGKWEIGISVVKNSQLKSMLELILKIKPLNY